MKDNSEELGLRMGKGISRRDFIKVTTIAGGAVSFPMISNGLQINGPEGAPDAPPDTLAEPPQFLQGTFKVNGQSHVLNFDSRLTLLDLVREKLELTGAKKGCDHGQCGACTVIVDGQRINSCMALAAQYRQKEIVTIEGLAKGDELHPMQKAFLEHDAFQCGFCTPGQIMSAVALLKEPCGKSEDDVRECMSGNICRCGAYRNILSAIDEVRGGKGGFDATV
jgi:xanthine dehydrogenase YagT iron-sulfur-binding subunit